MAITNYRLMKAWVKQQVDEAMRIEMSFAELPEQAQQEAILNNQLYNQSFDTNHNASDWSWEYNSETQEVIRGYLN